MQMIADLHTHTLCATHAYNTFTEMAAAAKALGYCALAVTDHAPAMPDAPHAWHFGNWSAMPRTIDGVAILYGAEANVMDTKGGLDLSQSQLKAQDWVVASIHSACVPGLLTRREANRLWLAVAENPYVDCIGHSEQQNYRYDYDLVTKAFAKNHKVVELNGNSVNVRRDGIPNMKLLLAACLKNGCHIALDTDAHSTTQLQGNMPPLLAMLEEMQFPQELVVNATRQNLVNELKLHGRICAEYIGGEIL
jgi:putative hydrolase